MNRFDLQPRYTGYDLDYDRGDGLTLSTPTLGYEFDVDEWGLYLGYSRSCGFGARNDQGWLGTKPWRPRRPSPSAPVLRLMTPP